MRDIELLEENDVENEIDLVKLYVWIENIEIEEKIINFEHLPITHIEKNHPSK